MGGAGRHRRCPRSVDRRRACRGAVRHLAPGEPAAPVGGGRGRLPRSARRRDRRRGRHRPRAAHRGRQGTSSSAGRPTGSRGIETALGVLLAAVDAGRLPLIRAIEALTTGPAALLGAAGTGAGTPARAVRRTSWSSTGAPPGPWTRRRCASKGHEHAAPRARAARRRPPDDRRRADRLHRGLIRRLSRGARQPASVRPRASTIIRCQRVRGGTPGGWPRGSATVRPWRGSRSWTASRSGACWQATMPDLPDRRGRELPDVGGRGGRRRRATPGCRPRAGLAGAGGERRAPRRRAARLGRVDAQRRDRATRASRRASRDLERAHGRPTAERLYRESIDAFEHVAGLCAGAIDADFVRSGHVVLASTPSHAASLGSAAEAYASLGEAARVVARADLRGEIGSDAFFGGLRRGAEWRAPPGQARRGPRAAGRGCGCGPPRGDAGAARAAPGGRPVGRRDVARRDPREGRDRRDQRLHGRTDAVAAAPAAADRQLHHRHRAAPRGPRRSADSPTGGCCSTRSTSSGTGGSPPTTGCCSAGVRRSWPTSIDRTAAILQRAMTEVHPQLRGTRIALRVGRPRRVHLRPDGRTSGARGRRDVRDWAAADPASRSCRGWGCASRSGSAVARRPRSPPAGSRSCRPRTRAGRGSCRSRGSTGRRGTGWRLARQRTDGPAAGWPRGQA